MLTGEKGFNSISTENSIWPNLLRNWEKFSTKPLCSREANVREEIDAECKEKEAHVKKVGQITMQVKWLKKSTELLGLETRKVNLVRKFLKTKELQLPVQKGAELLEVNRTSIYYKETPVLEKELVCKAIMAAFIRIISLGTLIKCHLNLKASVIRLCSRLQESTPLYDKKGN